MLRTKWLPNARPNTLLAHVSLLPPALPKCIQNHALPQRLPKPQMLLHGPVLAKQITEPQAVHVAAAHRSTEAADAAELSPRVAARRSTEAADAADVRPGAAAQMSTEAAEGADFRPPAHAQMSTDAADAADLSPGARRLPRMARTCTAATAP